MNLFNIFQIKEKYRLIIIFALLLVCFTTGYYFHAVLYTSTLYVNLFYVPIVLASMWWGYRGIIVSVILSIYLFFANLLFPLGSLLELIPIRLIFFILVSVLVSKSTERERKNLEDVILMDNEKLKESEEKFALAFDNANSGMCLVSLEGDLTKVNQKMSEIFGYSKNELERMNVNDIAYPEDLDLSPDFIKNSIEGEISKKSFEKRYYHKNGNIIWGLVSSALIKNNNGQPQYFISQIQDITERKIAEEALKKSEENFRIFFEKNPAYCYVMSPEGNFIDINKVALKALGYEKNELIGKHRSIIYPPESLPKMKEIFDKLEKVGHLKDEEITIVGKNGQKRTVLVSTETIKDDNGVWLKSISIHKDITEQKKIQAQYNEAVESSGIFHWVVNKDGLYTYITPSVQNILGYTCEEIENKKHFYDLVIDQDKEKVKHLGLEAIINKKSLEKFENYLLTKDGQIICVSTSGIPILDKDGELIEFSGLDMDITSIKKAEEKLKYRLLIEETIAQISERFSKFDNIEDGINTTLKNLGEVTNSDRAYVFLLNEDKSIANNTHEWCKEGVSPQIDNLKEVPMSMFPWAWDKLNNEGILIVEDISRLPPEVSNLTKSLQSQDIESAVLVSFYSKNGIIGFVGFDNVTKSKSWDTQDIYVLKMFAEILGTAYEKKSYIDDLREREETLKVIFSAAPAGINLFKNRICIWSNKGTEELTGYKIDELIGKSPRFLYETEDEYERVGKILYKIPREKDISEIQTKFITKDGSIKDVYIRNSPLDTNDFKKGFITVLLDITETKKAQKQIDENLEYFAHLVDYIRNPLAIISGFTQVEVDNKSTKERILRQIDRIEDMIKQLDKGWIDTEDTRRFLKKYM